jgi:hypothetical protein
LDINFVAGVANFQVMDEKAGEGHAEKKHDYDSCGDNTENPPNCIVSSRRLGLWVDGW